MIRWFADLPVERKLRVVIMLPATAAFGIASFMPIATNVRRDVRLERCRKLPERRAALRTVVLGNDHERKR